VDHVPARVVGDERAVGRPVDGHRPQRVVLDQEGAGGRESVEHGRSPVVGENSAVRVGVRRLADDQPAPVACSADASRSAVRRARRSAPVSDEPGGPRRGERAG
jgi:hypothetical protein